MSGQPHVPMPLADRKQPPELPVPAGLRLTAGAISWWQQGCSRWEVAVSSWDTSQSRVAWAAPALSSGAPGSVCCKAQPPPCLRPSPYVDEDGVDVAWGPIRIQGGHQDGSVGIRCRARGRERKDELPSLRTEAWGCPTHGGISRAPCSMGWRSLDGKAPAAPGHGS